MTLADSILAVVVSGSDEPVMLHQSIKREPVLPTEPARRLRDVALRQMRSSLDDTTIELARSFAKKLLLA